MKRKKILFLCVAIVAALVFLPKSVLATYTYTPMEQIPGFSATGDFPTYITNLYKFGLWTIGLAALLMISIGGFMYITSAGNNALMGKAKGIITDAIIGVLLAMVTYLLLYTINPDLVKFTPLTALPMPSSTGTTAANSAAAIQQQLAACNTWCAQNAADSSTTAGQQYNTNCTNGCAQDAANATAAQQAASAGSAGPGNGTCTDVSDPSNPCTTSNMSNTCFGSNAQQAAAICNAESSGGATAAGDKTTTGQPVSIGLFQINLTCHQVAGLNCPSAFSGGYTGSNHNITIVNQDLYNQCVTAAQDPTNNINTACTISSNGAHWGQWSTNTKCGFNK